MPATHGEGLATVAVPAIALAGRGDAAVSDIYDFEGFAERLRKAVKAQVKADKPSREAATALSHLNSHPLANYIRVHEIFSKHVEIARRQAHEL